MSVYQKKNSIEVRRAECARLHAKYPGQVPMVVEVRKEDKPRFLSLPPTSTVADLAASLQLMLNSAKTFSITIADCAPAAATTIGDMSEACRHADGFLYVCATAERAMGDTTVDLSKVPCGNPDNYTYS
ncbi:Autophagy protein Atg8 ubiquitin like [Novymonas esmeraldas]|uniref:Autophagy protein Atg8 ubiquitin like n=1 Tax=Novymonas esmeraldas TaxID=1808958 RepID=A0AAW0ERB1_9TRYP